MSGSKVKKVDDLPFEKALEQLESIVESMEDGDTPLEELVNKYTEGNALLKHCNKRLKEAEFKIEKLKANTEDTFKPLEDQ